MNVSKVNIFFYTGNPGPGMLDLVRKSVSNKMKTKLIIIDRGQDDLIPDFEGISTYVTLIKANYNGVSFRRILHLPYLFVYLLNVTKNGNHFALHVHTFDTLFLAVMVKCVRFMSKIELIYQIRDLHSLQVANSLPSKCILIFERLLLGFIQKLVVSSPGFSEFYRVKHGYTGPITLLENIPRRGIFRYRQKKVARPLVIGYIGILRYMASLNYLFETLATAGVSVQAFIAGGGDSSFITRKYQDYLVSDVRGSYEYEKDINELYSNVDIIYAVYDSCDYNCQVALPNKFYESILSGTPIIVASGTLLARYVCRLGIGVSVDILSDDLQNYLVAINSPDSWYEKAKEALASIDPEEYYSVYEKQLEEVVGE